MELREILSRCDHTLLRVDATAAEIRALCDQGMRYGCASVCIPPCHVAGAKKYVGDRLRICTVIGFPNGYNTPAVKAFEAAEAIRNGADEVDMVINLAMVKDGCWDDVAADIRAVREVSRGRILKVIIECCLLTEEEKRMLCRIVSDSGADYIKTSTGFSTGGATADDVRLLRTCCPPHVKVKAAGGIASLADAEEFIRLGADRLGTSRIVKIAMAQEQQAAEAAAAPQQPEAPHSRGACPAGNAGTAGHHLLSLPGGELLPHGPPQPHAGDGKPKPEQGIQRADLPEDVERPVCVVPDVPAEAQVDEHAGEILHRRDGSRAQRPAPPEHGALAPRDQIDQHGAHAAAQQHRPVRPAAPEQLQPAVA